MVKIASRLFFSSHLHNNYPYLVTIYCAENFLYHFVRKGRKKITRFSHLYYLEKRLEIYWVCLKDFVPRRPWNNCRKKPRFSKVNLQNHHIIIVKSKKRTGHLSVSGWNYFGNSVFVVKAVYETTLEVSF